MFPSSLPDSLPAESLKCAVHPDRLAAVLALLLLLFTGCGGSHSGQGVINPVEMPLTRLSTDTFTNSTSQHATEVEPDIVSFGSTLVSVFQVSRIFTGGSADIGFATSTNGGATWTNGFLPGTTVFQGGTFSAVSDPSVAFDAAHGVWILSSLLIGTSDFVAVSRSSDGLNWGNPVVVSATPDSDKNWISCDNTAASPFYGHCYLEWDDPSNNGLIWMATSIDGGLTWQAVNTADSAAGIGGQPLVQPNGNVVVPILSFLGDKLLAFSSTDGGASWTASIVLSNVVTHGVAGGLRTDPLPSATVDASGRVYVVWQDCRFRTNCSSNDLVLSTSPDGLSWSPLARIPIDATNSTVDHFIPGIASDPASSGSAAHLALAYYYYSSANCTSATCALFAAEVSSPDGGNTWSAPSVMAGPITVTWLPNTVSGYMVGDYIAAAFSGGKAFPVFASARANSGTVFDEAIFTTTTGLAAAQTKAVIRSAQESPMPNAHSDHALRQFYDLEHRYPIRRTTSPGPR